MGAGLGQGAFKELIKFNGFPGGSSGKERKHSVMEDGT